MKNKLVMWDDLLLLDYIGDIEDRYIPEYDCFEYSDSVSLEICEVTDEDFSEEELEMLDSMPVGASRCKSIFTTRYNDDLVRQKNIYATYRKELSLLVEKLELDVEKFWYLSLFILDYCESIFYSGESYKPTGLEQLHQLSNAIDKSQGEPMTLKFKAGKQKAELDSSMAITVISSLIKELTEQLDNDYLNEDQEGQQILKLRTLLNQREWKEEADMISDSPIIAYFANMFLSFFDTQEQISSKRKTGVKHTKTEIELVSKLIYLTGLSTNDNWNDIEFEYLKAFLKQYKGYRYPNNASSVYPEFTIE
jgi:hypothetical protein